jgi:peptidoglycan/LPS O-acetylase OafA/YrhL
VAKERNIGLDSLRAIAIIGVFLCHGLTLNLAGRDLLFALGSGVELFFVLSGFLIGRIYFRSTQSGSFSFWEFWRSRWWRTLPPYFAAILVYLAVGKVISAPGLRWYYVCFLQNYIGISGFGPSWSLCVEEHFYLVLPLIGMLIDRLAGRSKLKFILPIAIFIPLALRTAMLARPLPPQWYWFSHLHCDGLITGVYLAYLYVEDRLSFGRIRILAKWLIPVSPITMVIMTLWNPRPMALLLNTLYAVGYGAWVRYFYDLEWSPVFAAGRLARKGVQGIALCSYSVYLTHTTFDPAIRGHVLAGMHRGVGKSFLALSSTFLLGVGFYFLVERPTILTRDIYLKGRKSSVVDPGRAVLLSQVPTKGGSWPVVD